MGYCHKMVKEVAQGITEHFYEVAAQENVFYKQFPSAKRFVAAYWQHMIKPARETLVYMLGQPQYSAETKADIHKALILDHEAPRG